MAAPRVFTARDLATSASGAGGGEGRKHSTAHLEDPVTQRDIFGAVRGRCLQARSAQRGGVAQPTSFCLPKLRPADGHTARRRAVRSY